MKRIVVVGLVVAALAAVYLWGGRDDARQPAAVAADVPASTSGIVVEGLGRVTGTPDVLRVTLGVSVHRSDVSSALQAANSRQTKVRNALRKAGVAEKDLQTSDLNVSPDYDNRGRPDGFRVTETLTAKLRDIKRAGRVITDAAEAGGNEALVNGVSFTLEDNAALLAQARDAAFADAKAKAERYADLADRALGQVELVTEGSVPATPVPYATYDRAAKALQEAPIDAGTQDVTVSVTVRWALR
jgi:uncharacterized protein YggE